MTGVEREPDDLRSARADLSPQVASKASDSSKTDSSLNSASQAKDLSSERLMAEALKGLDMVSLIDRSVVGKSGADQVQASAPASLRGTEQYLLAEQLLGKDLGAVLSLDRVPGKQGVANALARDYFASKREDDSKGAEDALKNLEKEARQGNSKAGQTLEVLRLIDAVSTVQTGLTRGDTSTSQRGLTELAALSPSVSSAAFILEHFAEGKNGEINPLRQAQVRWARTAASGGDDAVLEAAKQLSEKVLPAEQDRQTRTKAMIDLALANYTLSEQGRGELAPQYQRAQALDTAASLEESLGQPERLSRSLKLALNLGQSGNTATAELLGSLGVSSPADLDGLLGKLSQPKGGAHAEVVAKIREWRNQENQPQNQFDQNQFNQNQFDQNQFDQGDRLPTPQSGQVYDDLIGNPNIPDSVKKYTNSLIPRVPPGSANLNDLNFLHQDDVHARNDLLTRHFLYGDQNARRDALEGLKREVQNGNLSAMQNLTQLALLDGTLKLTDASQRLKNAPDQASFQKAQSDQKQALRDLAVMELGDKKRENGISDVLASAPKLGVSAAEIAQARMQAANSQQQKDHLTSGALTAVVRGKNGAATADLERAARQGGTPAEMASEFISGNVGRTARVVDFARGAMGAIELAKVLDKPDKAADALVEINRLALSGNQTAQGIIGGVRSDSKGKEMLESLERGDKKAVLESLKHAEMVAALSAALEPAQRQTRELKAVKAEDILKAFSGGAGLDEARKEAKEYSAENFKQADQALGAFIERNQTAAQRAEALRSLNLVADDRLKTFGDYAFEGVRLSLDTIHQSKNIHEATVKATQAQSAELKPEEKQRALDEVAIALRALGKLANDGNHWQARAALNQLLASDAKTTVEDLSKRLEEGDASVLQLIKMQLPDGERELNDYRANRIVGNLGPESSSEQLAKARQQLEAEVKADQSEQFNKKAQDWLSWTTSAQSVNDISNAATKNDPAKALQAVEALAKEADAGNAYARAALAAVLLGGGRADGASENALQGRAAFSEAGFASTNDKPVYIANLKGLAPDAAELVMLKAVDSLRQSLEKSTKSGATLSRQEAGTLAIALAGQSLSESVDRSNSSPNKVRLAIESILSKAIEGPASSNVMDGIFTTIRHEVPGSKDLANVYLLGARENLLIAKQFNSLADWAKLGDQASMRIMAGIAGGVADDNKVANSLYREQDPISRRARSTLTDIGERPAQQAAVIDALVQVYAVQGDKNQLLATLGQVVGKSNSELLTPQVRAALYKGIEDSSDVKSHKSAVEGLTAIARHWNSADAKMVREHLTGPMVAALRDRADDIAPPVRTELIKELHQAVLKASNGTIDSSENNRRLDAVKAMGALAKSLDKAQVESIASFGGPDGLAKLKAMGITGDAAQEFQAQSGKLLLRVVSMSENAADGKNGPREAAYGAFLRHAWPGVGGQGLGVGGQGLGVAGRGLDNSGTSFFDSTGKAREPRDLREALLNYAQGRPWDVSLTKEISRVVYDAGLQRPPAGILQDWGVPGDLFAKANRITANYAGYADKSSDSAKSAAPVQSGEDILRRVASNIDMVNAMPPDLRKKLTGSAEPVIAAQVGGQMLNNTLQESGNRALLEDLPGKLQVLRLAAGKEVDRLTNEHATLRREKAHTLAELGRHTKEGVSFGDRVSSIFGGDSVNEFESKQVGLVKKLPGLNIKADLKSAELSSAGHEKHVLDLVKQIGSHTDIENKGQQLAADKLAVSMWREHGAMLQQLAPTVWKGLVASDGMQVGRSALARLKDAGLGQFDTVPSYERGSAGFKEALGTLQSLRYREAQDSNGFKFKEEYADTAAMRSHALNRLADDVAFAGIDRVSKTFNQALPEVSEMFNAAQKGTKFETFVNAAQDKAKVLKNAMDSISDKDLEEVRERVKAMREVADSMKANPDSNREALENLNARITNYEQMHDMLNRDLTKNFNKDKDVNGQLSQLITKISDPNFKADTFANWAKEHGPVIAATVVAVAATVATCVTLGVSSPLAIAAWASVAALGASELTKEGLYQVNSSGYSGFGTYGERSKAGAWAAKIDQRSDWENVKTLLTEVAGPYAGQVAFDTALAFATMGISKFALSGFSPAVVSRAGLKQLIVGEGKSMAQLAALSERAALTANGEGAAAHFMRDYMGNLGKELLINSGFTAAQLSAEKSVDAMTPERYKQIVHEGNSGISFGISTSLAIGQGLLASMRHGKGGKVNFEAKSPEAEKAFIDFYRKEGYEVKAIIAPGESKAARWEVRTFNQLEGQAPFVLERGTGLPEKDLFPGGVKEIKRPEGAVKVELPSEVEAHGQIWRQSEKGKAMLGELEHYSDAFMKGDFAAALKIATDKSAAPANYEVKQHPLDISLKALNDPASGGDNLRNTLKDMGDVSRASRKDGKLIAEIPQPILELESNIKVDLLGSSDHTVDGKSLTGEQQARLQVFKASQNGQRILQEMAVNSMEERIHLRQLDMGGAVASPSYARFIAENPNASPEQLNALRGVYDANHKQTGGRSALTMEQEAIMALHDSDPARWDSKTLRHHFGNQHSDVRDPLFRWLEKQEALRSGKPVHTSPQPSRLEFLGEHGEPLRRTSLGRNDAEDVKLQVQRLEREQVGHFIHDWKAELKKRPDIPPSERVIKESDVAQQVIYEQIVSTLQKPKGAGLPTLEQEGWQVYQAAKESPADHAKMDYILVNEKTGKYHILDATAQDKDLSSQIRRDSIVKWNSGHLDGRTAEGKMLNNAGKDMVNQKIAEMVAKEPILDIVTEPPPSLKRLSPEHTKAALDDYRTRLETSIRSESAKAEIASQSRAQRLRDYNLELPGSQHYLANQVKQNTAEHKAQQDYFNKTFGEQQIASAVRGWFEQKLKGKSPAAQSPLSDRSVEVKKESIEAATLDDRARPDKRYFIDANPDRLQAAMSKEFTDRDSRISEQLKKKEITRTQADSQRERLYEAKREFEGSHGTIREAVAQKLKTQPWARMRGEDSTANAGAKAGEKPASKPNAKPDGSTLKKTTEVLKPQEVDALQAVADKWREWAEVVENKTLGAKFNPELKTVISDAVEAVNQNPKLTEAQKAEVGKLSTGYVEGNAAGIKKVHEFLERSSDTKPLGRNEDSLALSIDKGHEELAQGEIKATSMTKQGQEPINVYVGKQTLTGQPDRDVIIRTPRQGGSEEGLMKRAGREDAAYETSKYLNFGDANYPAISQRAVEIDGKTVTAIVQEHAGITLGDFVASKEYLALTKAQHAELKSGIELASAQRQVMGDSDFSNNNFAVKIDQAGKVHVSNIDMGRAFTTELRPSWGIGGVSATSPFAGLPGKPLSTEVKARVEDFLKAIDQAAVRENLRLTGLEDYQIGYMKLRAQGLLANGFPQ